MKSIQLRKISKSHHTASILHDIDLEVPSGKFFALLGPSGCGKTTLLRLIAGLDHPDSGAIYLGEKEITHLPPYLRSINIVFQNYALFPHLDLFHNVAYSLEVKKCSSKEIKERVFKALKALHLESHAKKLPSQLSGGQQQRAALARAIISEPDVLLLDEPLAALDFNMREKVLIELIELQDALKTTFIYVTHDQSEALTVADYMAIMAPDGTLAQLGTPKEIYEFPTSPFVAQFVGKANILKGTLSALCAHPFVTIPDLGRFSALIEEQKSWMREGGEVTMVLRPEKIFISKEPKPPSFNQVKGTITHIVYDGRSTQYTVEVTPSCSFIVFEQNDQHVAQENFDYDDLVYLHWKRESALLLEGE